MSPHAACWLILAPLAIASPSGSATCPAAVIYDQPAVYPAPFSGWTSDVDPAGFGFRSYDNFRIAQAALVTGVDWQGLYWVSATPGNNPVATVTTSWLIGCFAGAPPLPSWVRPYRPPQSPPGTSARRPSRAAPSPSTTSTRNLPASFAAAATTYWFSPLSSQPSTNPRFSWMAGTDGDAFSLQDGLPSPPGMRFSRTGERAFDLVGQAVPEPSSVGLLGVGVAAAVATASSRRTRRGSSTIR
jgi:hypothetical protein